MDCWRVVGWCLRRGVEKTPRVSLISLFLLLWENLRSCSVMVYLPVQISGSISYTSRMIDSRTNDSRKDILKSYFNNFNSIFIIFHYSQSGCFAIWWFYRYQFVWNDSLWTYFNEFLKCSKSMLSRVLFFELCL